MSFKKRPAPGGTPSYLGAVPSFLPIITPTLNSENIRRCREDEGGKLYNPITNRCISRETAKKYVDDGLLVISGNGVLVPTGVVSSLGVDCVTNEGRAMLCIERIYKKYPKLRQSCITDVGKVQDASGVKMMITDPTKSSVIGVVTGDNQIRRVPPPPRGGPPPPPPPPMKTSTGVKSVLPVTRATPSLASAISNAPPLSKAQSKKLDSVSGTTSLLNDIRRGAKLKPASQRKIQKTAESVGMGDMLRRQMDARRFALRAQEDDDEGDDDADGWDD